MGWISGTLSVKNARVLVYTCTQHVLSPIVKVVMKTGVLSQQLSVWQTELIPPS